MKRIVLLIAIIFAFGTAMAQPKSRKNDTKKKSAPSNGMTMKVFRPT